MDVLEHIDIWTSSLRNLFEAFGIEVRIQHASERINSSYALNLRRGPREPDLIIWESGEAELALVDEIGSLEENHYDDIRSTEELANLLSKMIKTMMLPKN